MVESESIQSTLKDSNKYKNLSYKVKNRALAEGTAWQVFVEHFKDPQALHELDFLSGKEIGKLETVFSLRRRAFFGDIANQEASGKIQKIYEDLSPSEKNLLTAPIIMIRDLFDRQLHYKKPKKG